MSRRYQNCSCEERPRCQIRWCGNYATVSTWMPSWPSEEKPHNGLYRFMCRPHWEDYRDAIENPLPGITPPPGADEDWRPSLLDHVRLCQIRLEFDDRVRREKELGAVIAQYPAVEITEADRARYTPEQLKNLVVMRHWTRILRAEGRL